MKDITRRRLLWSIPFAGAVIAGGGFVAMLSGLKKGNFDPRDINTPILNKPIPDFSLTCNNPHIQFDNHLLKQQTKPVLLNFFASWCLPCVGEMPILNALKNQITIWGIAYKDKPNMMNDFLSRYGNPYQYIGLDETGTTGIDWGISGVPESFLIMPGGVVKWHYPKPLDSHNIQYLLSLLS